MKQLFLPVSMGAVVLCGAFLLAPYIQAQAMELAVPRVSQVPDGVWVAPWDEACEEASILMVNGFYERSDAISKDISKQKIRQMVEWENKTFTHYQDTNAVETVRLIQQFGTFGATIKRSPTLAEIKRELDQQQPVIALVNMYLFYNQPSEGDSYHVFVIKGYDEEKKEFLVADPGREEQRYSYDRVMRALHDYNPTSKEADGEPTVLFTHPKPSALKQAFLHFVSFFKRLLV